MAQIKSLLRVRKIATRGDLQRAFSIRLRVFVAEQGVPREIELDNEDTAAIHFLASWDGQAVGTARLVLKNETAKIGRMAVLKRHRNKGIGRGLLKRAVEYCRKHKAKVVFLNAQVPVIGFYEKMGFACAGKSFVEAGIPHRRMILLKDRGRKH